MITFFWHRRDLRTDDNVGLYHALRDAANDSRVQPIFIFDTQILGKLKSREDARVSLIYRWVEELGHDYSRLGAKLWIFHGEPEQIFAQLCQKYSVQSVYTNHDYEPEAIRRDLAVLRLLKGKGIVFKTFKDQVIFEKSEILNNQGNPYTVFTAYKNKWLLQFRQMKIENLDTSRFKNKFFASSQSHWLGFKELGFIENLQIIAPEFDIDKNLLINYQRDRDFPDKQGTSRIGVALRFGKVSIRKMILEADKYSPTWLSELIWREFFMQILFHYPRVCRQSFRPAFDKIAWRKSKSDFEKWKNGKTGYPIVDAGMRELNQTGYMHNRVRMIAGSFLTKHLLIHWYHGERYFAEKLLDYDLSANNGNWQWVAGSGCDAAPYFRIFNPEVQTKRFDPHLEYIKKWVPEFGTANYPEPMIEHSLARDRALKAFSILSRLQMKQTSSATKNKTN